MGGLMRMPTRRRITWESDEVLRIETDSGLQVRRLFFSSSPPVLRKTLQGRSVAQWQLAMPTGESGNPK